MLSTWNKIKWIGAGGDDERTTTTSTFFSITFVTWNKAKTYEEQGKGVHPTHPSIHPSRLMMTLTRNASFSSLLRLSSAHIAAISDSCFLCSTLAALIERRRCSRLLVMERALSSPSAGERPSISALRKEKKAVRGHER